VDVVPVPDPYPWVCVDLHTSSLDIWNPMAKIEYFLLAVYQNVGNYVSRHNISANSSINAQNCHADSGGKMVKSMDTH